MTRPPSHETERISRFLNDGGSTIPPTPSPSRFEARIEFPSWLEEQEEPPPAPASKSASASAPEKGFQGAFQLAVRCQGRVLARQVFSQERVSIGRSNDCDLRLDDPTISRFHAVIERQAGHYTLRDLKSSNGVRVRGARVKVWRLNDGEQFALGEFELSFRLERVPGPWGGAPPRLHQAGGVERVFGTTLRLSRARRENPELRERSVKSRAYLQVAPGTTRVWPLAQQFVLERDVFTIGGGADANLRVTSWRVPRIACVILRGPSGYSLDPVSGWPASVYLNGKALLRTERLEARDEIEVAGQKLIFQPGMPSA